jgi:hypothetical protein
MFDTFTNGSARVVYHNGSFCFYRKTENDFAIYTNDTANGLVSDAWLNQYFVYRPKSGEEITWINNEGGWSFWKFRSVDKMFEVKNNNEVENWALSNFELNAPSETISQEVGFELTFDTVAVDTLHHSYLCEIAMSPRVVYGGRVYQVKDCTKSHGSERQNLKFELTLKIKENGY